MEQKNFIGYRQYINVTDVSLEYAMLGKKNEEAAILLEKQGFYNEAVYMYIQAMEKKIKGYICGKINPENPYFSNKLRQIGHSLDLSIDFLIEILSGNNEVLKIQLTKQIKNEVFQNIKFSKLYNECRYPRYDIYKKGYSALVISQNDCLRISDINKRLDKFILDFNKL